MDVPLPADPNQTQAAALSPAVLNCMLRLLAASLPMDGASAEIRAENLEAAREMFLASKPQDAVEAAAVVRSVAAHFASMDMYARAARPGLTDETARRLRASATACARAAEAAKRSMAKPPATAIRKSAKTEALPPTPVDYSKPTVVPPEPRDECFQPRDRFGNPIPNWRTDLMTKAQLYAALAYPRNPELEKVALAEEEAMIATQQAEDAKQANLAGSGSPHAPSS